MNFAARKRLTEAEAAFVEAFGPPAPCPVLPPAMVDEAFEALAVLRAGPGFWKRAPEERDRLERAVKMSFVQKFIERKNP